MGKPTNKPKAKSSAKRKPAAAPAPEHPWQVVDPADHRAAERTASNRALLQLVALVDEATDIALAWAEDHPARCRCRHCAYLGPEKQLYAREMNAVPVFLQWVRATLDHVALSDPGRD